MTRQFLSFGAYRNGGKVPKCIGITVWHLQRRSMGCFPWAHRE
jgi:hypothetical protein